MPFGLLADGWNRNAVVSAVGCALVIVGYLPALPAGVTAVVAGVGNGLFHVGGGIDVLNDSQDDPSALGVFVSPGALGLFLGGVLGKAGAVPALVPVALLFAGIGAILVAANGTYHGFWSHNAPADLSLPQGGMSALVLLTVVVVLRSYMGFNQTLPWKGEGHWAVALTLALVLGKAAGGFLGKMLGAKRAAALSLGGSAVFYLFSGVPILGVGAVLLFNMTMPITLWAAARLLPGGKGFAFGLLTFGLFLGFLPTWLGWQSVLTQPWSMALAALLSAVLLLLGLKGEER
jgi:FSR family fosmidomycin resistance protein-like MFS transporter